MNDQPDKVCSEQTYPPQPAQVGYLLIRTNYVASDDSVPEDQAEKNQINANGEVARCVRKLVEDEGGFLRGAVVSAGDVANIIIAQFLFLESEDPDKDIQLYINSPGGSVSAGLAIYDTMQLVTCDVATYCIGQAASMGSLLLAAGAPEMRFALPNSRIMVHQPSGGFQGQATDIEIHTREILKIRSQLNDLLAYHSGQSVKTIAQDTERDNFMSPEEAKKYGLIDELIDTRKDDSSDKK